MAKDKKLSAASMKKLQGVFGKETIANLNDGANISIERLSSGSMDLDRILGGRDGNYGWPKGRISEMYAPPSAGKSSVAISTIVEAQESGLIAAYVDMEAAYDPDYAEELGVNNDTLLYSAPNNGEEALDLVEALLTTGEVGLVILDSSNACVPQSEVEGEMGDNTMAVQARLFSKAMRKFPISVKNSGAVLIIISQIRMKIISFGDPRQIGVGNAILFADSIRLEILADKPVEKDGVPFGHNMRFLTVKNKTNRPKMRANAFFEYFKGFCKFTEVLSLGADLGIVEKKGAWYAYNGTNIGQGIEKSAEILKDNPELFQELLGLVKQGLKEQR